MEKFTPGEWIAVKGDVLNPDRTWGVVVYLSKEGHEEIDGPDCEYPSRTEIIAEVCIGPTDESDAHLLASAKPMYYLLSDILSAMNWGGMKRPKQWERRIQDLVEKAGGVRWINYAQRPMPR